MRLRRKSLLCLPSRLCSSPSLPGARANRRRPTAAAWLLLPSMANVLTGVALMRVRKELKMIYEDPPLVSARGPKRRTRVRLRLVRLSPPICVRHARSLATCPCVLCPSP